jgi:predicted DNA-binding transcriptional regulator YafY
VSTNKHAIIRYQTLDKCFRNTGRKYYMDDLIEACNNALFEFDVYESEEPREGISRRTIYDDIEFMESPRGWNIDLERTREGRKVYYRYTNTSFTINKQPLNETEEHQLKEALSTLSRFKGLPQFGWVDELIARLDSGLGLSHNAKKIIEFDQNNYLKGLEYITTLYNAILYKKVINIEYKSFKQEAVQTFILHPYFLKQYNNRWYVFGKNDASGYVINLALDRIIAIKDSNKKYILNEEINFDEYFEDIVGVTLNNGMATEKIVLKVSNVLFPYIQTKPLHGSQKVKEQGDAHTLITLDLIPNYELESVILSHGEGIEVLKPESLREKINERAGLIKKKYSNAD